MKRCAEWSPGFSRAAAALLLLVSCATSAPEPVLPELRERLAETTVVLVPGVTGTKLVDRSTGRTVWGNTWSFLSPHDGGHAMALPIVNSQDTIDPDGPIEEIRLLTYRKEVYGTVVRLMEKNGLRRGDLENPRDGDRFFFFNYDWRRDNIAAARQLARQLELLGRFAQRRRVALICQSNAAYICRYLAKYGDVSLAQAETGARRPVSAVALEKIILVGNSNGGAMRILHGLDRGRRYVKFVGRTWLPETIFTVRSLFQDLPVVPSDLFVSAEGNALAIDLFDAESWKTYGWSVYRSDARQRASRRPDLFGTEADRDAYLRENLAAAKRLHALMQRDSADTRLPRFYSIQSDSLATPARAMITARNGKWETRFFHDDHLPKALAAVVSAPGDAHATVQSQQFLSPAEKAALVRPTIYVNEQHFEIITLPDVQRRILEILAE